MAVALSGCLLSTGVPACLVLGGVRSRLWYVAGDFAESPAHFVQGGGGHGVHYGGHTWIPLLLALDHGRRRGALTSEYAEEQG